MTKMESLKWEHGYESQDPNYKTPFWVYCVQRVLGSWRDRLVCKIKGCDLVDDDPGDAEVGPQPDIYCTRCGKF